MRRGLVAFALVIGLTSPIACGRTQRAAPRPASTFSGGAGTGYRYQRFGTFREWDSNGDQRLSFLELRRGLSSGGLFATWDRNGDGRLSRKEFERALYDAWNTNGDQGIDIGELTAGAVSWFPTRATSSIQFTVWDRDRDGLVTRREFHQGFEALGLWDRWDDNGDGAIDNAEYAGALLSSWDTNSDGVIDLYEYRWAG